MLAALGKLGDEGAPGGCCSPKVLPVAEELAPRCASTPPAEAVEVAGSARRLGRDVQGHRPDRDRDRPGGARGGAHRAPARRPGRVRRRVRRPDRHPQRDLGRPADRRRRRSSATCSSTSPARRRTTSSCASARSKLGLSVSEHGITETESGKVARYATEEEVYERLGLPYIEPELREGNGEIAAAAEGELPELVELGDIRGDLHCHTTLSDGRNSLEEMAEARAGARLRLPGDHRPLRQPRVRRPRHRRAAAASGSRRSRPERVAARQALPAARRLGGQHRHRRLARLRRRAAGAARLGDRQRPHLVPDLGARR